MVLKSIEIRKEVGYNIPDVFGRWYLKILRDYQSVAGFSRSSYKYEKKKVYKNLVYGFYFNFANPHPKNSRVRGRFFASTVDYHCEWYYWMSFVMWPMFWIEARVRRSLPVSFRTRFLGAYRALRKIFGWQELEHIETTKKSVFKESD